MRYLTQRVLLISTMLLASAASAHAQSVSGTVTGLDASPTGATVTVLDTKKRIMGEAVVAPDGSFSFAGEKMVGSIVVRQEAVSISRGVVGGAAVGIAVDLRTAVRWTRSVIMLDPAGAPSVGLDVLLLDRAARTISCVTSGAHGWLHVRGNEPVASLLVDPLGWHHAVSVKFEPCKVPVDTIPDLTIDMRPHAHKFVLLQGSIIDLDGNLVGGARLTASKKVGSRIVPCGLGRVNDDGRFKIWTTRDATTLSARGGGETWKRSGDWSAGGVQIVDLQTRRDGVVMVTGFVRDKDGKPVDDAIIHVSDTAKIPDGARGIAGSGRAGTFRVFIRRAAPFLIADLRDGRGIATKAGPWPQENVVLKASK